MKRFIIVLRINLRFEYHRALDIIKARGNKVFSPGAGGRRSSFHPAGCNGCDWMGSEKDAEHSYRSDGADCVEAIDYCPECGGESDRMKSWRNHFEATCKALDVWLAPLFTNGFKSGGRA